MSVQEMKELRERAKLTQAQMAERMGLGKTAYVDLELGDADWKKFKDRHRLALERASLTLALERGDIGLALPTVRRDALALAALITSDSRDGGSFSRWLLDKTDRDDEIGRLAKDAKADPSWPHGTPGQCLDYLNRRQKREGASMLLNALREYMA